MAEVYVTTPTLFFDMCMMASHNLCYRSPALVMLCTCMICGVFDVCCITKCYNRCLTHDDLVQGNATVQHYSNRISGNARLLHATLSLMKT